jgi:hypothetical protein
MSDAQTSEQRVGSVFGNRRMRSVSNRSRRRCFCGCKKRATHMGMDGEICLVTACELYIRRWVRDGIKTRKARS